MENILVSAYTPSESSRNVNLRAHRITTLEHIWFVFKKLVIYWGLAAVTFFIPVYNVFLTPFFFLVGCYVGIKVERAKFEILQGRITCPHCEEPIKLKNEVLTEDFDITCPHCVTLVRLDVIKT